MSELIDLTHTHTSLCATSKEPQMNDKKLTSMETFWYYLQCISFGAGYFAKVPVKKALTERGLASMSAAENIWYVIMCLCFGLGYFQKVIYKKALSEMEGKFFIEE
jgi:hypothetical protein